MLQRMARFLVLAVCVAVWIGAVGVIDDDDSGVVIEGFLYKKLQAYGTRSEGPRYMLQSLMGRKEVDYILERIPRNPWEPDELLESYMHRKVIVKGRVRGNRLYIDEIRGKDEPPGGGFDKPVRTKPLPIRGIEHDTGCYKRQTLGSSARWKRREVRCRAVFKTPKPCYDLITMRASQTGKVVTVVMNFERRPGLCAECEGLQEVEYRILDLKPVEDYQLKVNIYFDGEVVRQGTLLALTH